MDLALDILSAWGQAALRLLLHPFYYLGIVLILLQYRRQIQLERKLFHSRIHHLASEAWRLVLWGLAAGSGVSLVMAFLGSALTAEAVLLLWAAAGILMLFRLRFLCIAYAAGVLGTVKAVLDWVPAGSDYAAAGWLYRWMERVDAPGLLALAGVLHLAEAMLIRYQGSRTASPLFLESKRGRIMGGFQMYGFWPLAMFLIVPAAGSGGIGLPWEPLFGAGLVSGGWTVLAVPAVLGFTEQTWTELPRVKARRSSGLLMVYAVAVVGLALAAHWVAPLLIAASVLTIILHEALIWISNWQEAKRQPIYVHEPQGLKILAVLPGSPAAALGLETGEIIEKVNGMRVRTKEELHLALQANPAYCKLELLNLDGQTRFAGRAVFSGDHHQLGILLCPDDDARYVVEQRRGRGLLSALFQNLGGLPGKAGSGKSV
ncbi:MAG: serine protease [Paenibacillaceae bacterium]|jgi:hypothetical protein|nr:serine protease [Paenibacillaceae bacterium]